MSESRSRADFSLEHPKVACQVTDLDAVCHEHGKDLNALLTAIVRLTDDDVVRRLAEQARALAGQATNAVNCFAEDLGCNYRGEPELRAVARSSHEEPGAMQ